MRYSWIKIHSAFCLVLFVYGTLVMTNNFRFPLGVGPDEVAHFSLARFLREKGYLPLTIEERQEAGYKSDQPPLNAVLVAGAFFWGELNKPPFVKLSHRVPRRHLLIDGVVDKTGRAFNVVNMAEPLAGDYLFWHFGRLMSAIFSGLTLVVIYCIAWQFFADRHQRNLHALAAVMTIAFIPTFTYISSMVSYENLLGLWLALYLLVAVYLIKGSKSHWLYLLAGLLVGLAIVTKLGALFAPLTLFILVGLIGWRDGAKGKFLKPLALSLGGILLGAGWWFVLIESKLNQVAEQGWLAGLLAPIIIGDGSDAASAKIVSSLSRGTLEIEPSYWWRIGEWLGKFYQTFWLFQAKGQPLSANLLRLMALLILLGLLRVWWQNKAARLSLVFLGSYFLIFLILPLIRFLTTGLVGVAGQGQHLLFPAAGAVAILMVEGLGAWLPKKPWLGGVMLGIAMLIWNVSLTMQYSPPTPLPVRTVPPIMPSSATKFELDFDSMLLQGYELTGLTSSGECCAAKPPVLGVNLYWVAKKFNQEDYLTTINLVDRSGNVQNAWLGYGVNGRYPSRAWEPGDIIHDELYLPVDKLETGNYTLTMEVKGNKSPLATQEGQTVFTLTQISLANDNISAKTKREESVELWQEGQRVEKQTSFEERATIQVVTDQTVSLVGADHQPRPPLKIAGQTHLFVIDPLWPKGNYQLQIGSNSLATPTFTIKGPRRQTAIPTSETVVKANFANQLMLLGYNLPQRQITAAETLAVMLHWQALQTMPTDFTMFVRLYDDKGQMWGGYDRWPQEYYSPLMWVAGEVVEDGFTLPIKANAPDGVYYLDVGFYFMVGQAPVSLPLIQDGKMSKVTSVAIGPIKIER